MSDRKFGRMIGLGMNLRAPFHNVSLMPHIAKLRNAKVDELIQAHLRNADPMADQEPVALGVERRSKQFADARVPPIITVKIAGFTMPAGEKKA